MAFEVAEEASPGDLPRFILQRMWLVSGEPACVTDLT